MRFVFAFLAAIVLVHGNNLDFDLIKKHGKKPGDTLLVIGGIHGDEPGSYFAPMLLSTSYSIKSGNLWIVPNLNFDSIVAFRRGVYGDMNRKFAHIEKDDPDYGSVKRIQSLITADPIDLVLNLHDGHGYYRQQWESSIFNPAAWGQASIIDQQHVPGLKYGALDKIANKVAARLNNGFLEQNHHKFGVKNTQTKYKDEQQQLSLTFFSITHDTAAFAIETSKNIRQLHLKVFYQLQAIEAYMDIMGIEYERDFELNKQSVKNKLQKQGTVTINDTITFDLDELKKVLYYVPLKKEGNTVTSNNPLIAVAPHSTPKRELFKLNIGHKTVSYLYPDYFKMEHGLQKLAITADNRRQEVSVPGSFSFTEDFAVHAPKQYRVNIIGYTNGNENNVTVGADQIPKRFSLDKAGTHYRIELYKEGKFAGMVIARHTDE